MFEVGEYIVYGCKGVCQVEEITHIDIPGSNKDRLYYVLAPLEDRNGKIYAPTDNAKVAMRKVITRQEAEQLIEDERFLQVSRGVLCNMDHILEMSKRDCKLSCGITVPITMRNATKLKQQWRDYEFAKIRRSSEERVRK